MAHAALDPEFIKECECEIGCNKIYKQDTTPEKLMYQNCTTICAFTFESKAGDDFLACAMNYRCVEFPEIPGKCPMPAIEPTASLASLEGEWWQHRGKNALWDCYPCQHIHSMFVVNDSEWCATTTSPQGPVQAPCFNYSFSYDLYIKDGAGGFKTRYFGHSWQLPGNVPEGNRIDFYYEYMGSYHNESWYILHATQRYVLLVDCSYMMAWVDVSSIVWVRPNVELTTEENAQIKKIYADKLGWSYDDFCHDRHGADSCEASPPTGKIKQSAVGGRRAALRRSRLLATMGDDVRQALKAHSAVGVNVTE